MDTDARLLRLVEQLGPLGYGVIILADHGQHDAEPVETVSLKGTHGTESPEDCLVRCTWAKGAPPWMAVPRRAAAPSLFTNKSCKFS